LDDDDDDDNDDDDDADDDGMTNSISYRARPLSTP
jgi:hypothetical protein